MKIFSALFSMLAGQALLVAVLPGAFLMWNATRGHEALLARQDRQSLGGFATLVAAEVRGGTSLAGALPAIQQRFAVNSQPGDPAPPLAGRIAVYDTKGRRLAGAMPDDAGVRMQRPIMLDGRPLGSARIVAARGTAPVIHQYVRDQVIGVVIAVAGIFLLLLVGAYIIAGRWAAPQVALFRASRAIAQGDYAADVSESGPAETRATMRNLGRIARQFDRLETARRTWLVAVSEELRKPVAALGARLEAIRTDSPPTDPAAFVDVVEDVRRLGEMAEDLHAVALADLGRLPVTFAPVDPRALIYNAVRAMKRRAELHRVSLEPGDLPQSAVPVKWDGGRIEQLFTALIENSLRYTPAGGRITIGLDGQRGAWRLIVDDSAPGVDIDLAQRLFEPFYRTTTLPGESVTSSGLGLATAQAIVEAHHGRIEATRSSLGGLRITVILPGAPPTA